MLCTIDPHYGHLNLKPPTRAKVFRTLPPPTFQPLNWALVTVRDFIEVTMMGIYSKFHGFFIMVT